MQDFKKDMKQIFQILEFQIVQGQPSEALSLPPCKFSLWVCVCVWGGGGGGGKWAIAYF